jgi:hypothetical protein
MLHRCRIAGEDEGVPFELRGGVVRLLALARRQQLQDMAGGVAGAAVGRVQLVSLAFLVLGHHQIDPAGDRVGFEILGRSINVAPSRSPALRACIIPHRPGY